MRGLSCTLSHIGYITMVFVILYFLYKKKLAGEYFFLFILNDKLGGACIHVAGKNILKKDSAGRGLTCTIQTFHNNATFTWTKGGYNDYLFLPIFKYFDYMDRGFCTILIKLMIVKCI